MPSASEASNSKPPLGAALADGVRVLSVDQELTFYLYQRYVFPLDGMVYWIKFPGQGTVTTPGVQATAGLNKQIMADGEAVQVSPGGIGAVGSAGSSVIGGAIIGGTITNPLTAADQGLDVAESLFVDFTGPAYHYVNGTTRELKPGQSVQIPPNCLSGAWVSALSGGHQFSCVLQNSIISAVVPVSITVKGSLHYSSVVNQEEDSTYDSNEIIFTSLSEVQPFNIVGPNYMYICDYGDISFAFSSRGRLYEQADLYHYRGTALKSRFYTQIVRDINQFNPTLIISNSLPLWLNMPNYVPPYPGFTCPLPLYPSYLVDDNLPPPFGAIHIEGTQTIEMGSSYGPRMEQSQLVSEKVKVHLYGADNKMASDFVSFVEQYSLDWMKLGLSESPAIIDVKQTHAEFLILAQRKLIEFNINYRQWVIRDEARQFIEHVRVQFIPQWLQN